MVGQQRCLCITAKPSETVLNWPVVITSPGKTAILPGIKLLHTLVWAFFAGCILAIPVTAWANRFTAGSVLSGFVLFECLILAANHGRCPLTDLAAAHTDERADNFDIYLPLWLAKYNKIIFGSLFVAGEIFLLAMWMAH
jgi:hypothetical protein